MMDVRDGEMISYNVTKMVLEKIFNKRDKTSVQKQW
jgi:hypothetical protein